MELADLSCLSFQFQEGAHGILGNFSFRFPPRYFRFPLHVHCTSGSLPGTSDSHYTYIRFPPRYFRFPLHVHPVPSQVLPIPTPCTLYIRFPPRYFRFPLHVHPVPSQVLPIPTPCTSGSLPDTSDSHSMYIRFPPRYFRFPLHVHPVPSQVQLLSSQILPFPFEGESTSLTFISTFHPAMQLWYLYFPS